MISDTDDRLNGNNFFNFNAIVVGSVRVFHVGMWKCGALNVLKSLHLFPKSGSLQMKRRQVVGFKAALIVYREVERMHYTVNKRQPLEKSSFFES